MEPELLPVELPPGATPFELICQHCGAPIQTHVSNECDLNDDATKALVDKIARSLKWLCVECKQKFEGHHAQLQRWERSREWAKICPLEFRETVVDRLPLPNLLGRTMRWQYQAKGRALIGPSGKGKSRCAWKLCEREFLAGRDVRVLTNRFGIEFAQKYGVGAGAAFDWCDEIWKAELLLLDDVFKTKLTDAAESALFNIINTRTENQLPMIITMQDTGSTLEARMTPDRGPALTRRIREFCEVITFN